MNQNAFKLVYLSIFGAATLLGFGIYLNTKSLNDSEKSLTLKRLITNPQLYLNAKQQFPLPPGTNLLTRERIYTQDEIDSMTPNEFKAMITDIERRLPTKDDGKQIPSQALQRTPPIEIEAGRNLNAINEVVKTHPGYESMAMIFFEKCASNDLGSVNSRAICLTNLIVHNKKNGSAINLSKFPIEIIKLAKLVTEI
jgi:hypothetical protein